MRRPDNEPLLFDLPLDRPPHDGDPDGDGDAAKSSRGASRAEPESPALSALAPGGGQVGASPSAAASRKQRDRSPRPAKQSDLAGLVDPRLQAAPAGREQPPATPATATAPPDGRVSIGRRAAAGVADLLVHLAVAVVALAGCRYLGVFPEVRDWPAIAVFLLSFSFLYTVVPLAFWGHTLGMTWAGLSTESAAGEPLTFDQTARRWLGALLTLAVLGLPLLLATSGRSLADRLSGSRTLAS